MPNADSFPLIAKTFTGLEGVLAAELTELGVRDVAPGRRMVSFAGDRVLLYRANLWCRTAVRILKPIATFELDPSVDPGRALQAGLTQIDWRAHLDVSGTLAIDPVVHNSPLTNSMYAAQLAKDAIADWFRARHDGRRPSVDKHDPDLRINLHVDGCRVTIYLDSSGPSLHKRGYRLQTNEAPLSEVLAAGILKLSAWQSGTPLVDFMCGSGTLPIEAALMAANIAPGLIRERFGYMRWPDFDARLQARLLDEARHARREVEPVSIFGSDLDERVISAARDNAKRAGVARLIRLAAANFETAIPPAAAGTIVINPPYDERQKLDSVAAFYRRLGDVLKRRWGGYTAWIFSGNLSASKQIGLRTAARIPLFNGPIECRLLKFPLVALAAKAPSSLQPADSVLSAEHEADSADDQAAARLTLSGDSAPALVGVATQSSVAATLDAFGNRLRRMGKHWARWARRQGISCYRVYDREIPEVPLSIDRFEEHLHIVEHARPHGRSQLEQQLFVDELVRIAGNELGVPSERVHAHLRSAESSSPGARQMVSVREADCSIAVSLANRGETGLALDERQVRDLIAAEATGKRFLNLFGRGGAASVRAASAGALHTTTVESSPGLAAWSRENLELGNCDEPAHVVVEAPAAEFLRSLPDEEPKFDLALVSPPGSYHRRSDQQAWDARPEFLSLLGALLPAMSVGSTIYFVTSVRRFRLDGGDLSGATIREITRQTTPPDFRAKPPHRAWSIIRTGNG